jgi:hypothetical protein
MTKRLLFLCLLYFVVSGLSASGTVSSSKNVHRENSEWSLTTARAEETWKLIYTDALVKVYSTEIVCTGTNTLKLKIENLSDSDITLTYRIWADAQMSKPVKVPAKQFLEGICAPEYNNLLVEAIPAGSTAADVKVQINY